MRVFFALAVLAGCTTSQISEPPSGGGKADGDLATLSFDADWSVTQSAPLVKGALMVVHYDPARLTACRAKDASGEDAWQIVGHYTLDGTEPYGDDLAVTELEGNGRLEPPSERPVDVTMDVPLGTFGGGHDLAMWFVNTDATGCIAYDSDYGANYHFTIEDAP
ncbi:MAG: DUF6209 family protein [Acidobacteriota bacterium]